jgi:hypothetical protein
MRSVNYDNGNNIKPQFAQLLRYFGQQYVAIFVRNAIGRKILFRLSASRSPRMGVDPHLRHGSILLNCVLN